MFLLVWGSSEVKPCLKEMPFGGNVLVTGKAKTTISHFILLIGISFDLFSINSSSHKVIPSFLSSNTELTPKHSQKTLQVRSFCNYNLEFIFYKLLL